MFPLALVLLTPAADPPPFADQPPHTWVKRSPRPGGPPSPALGYEGSLVWDAKHKRVIRFAGHNQGGGGEQNAETWSFDPLTAKWELKESNTSPPGACCNQQNVFDAHQGRFLRFPAFSGSHGWQWFREIYLSNSTAWSYDLGENRWRDRRPLPAPRVAPLRCASWDSEYQVGVVFGGEGSNEGTLVYDPYTNTWHRLGPATQPEPRSGGNMAYDAANRLHVLFGSQFGTDPATWTFDLARNEWRAHRAEGGPPADRSDPVMAYDHAARQVVAVVRTIDRTDGKEIAGGHVETWAFDAAAKAWAKRNPPREPDGWSNRSRVMVAMPELNALLLESVVNPTQRVKGVDREQQMWTYRLGEPKAPAVPVPVGLRVRAEAKAAVVEWDGPRGADVETYLLFRGDGPTPWQAEYKLIATKGALERERRFARDDREYRVRDEGAGDRPVFYKVKAVAKAGESTFTPVERAQPRMPDDVHTTVVDAKRVTVWWLPKGAGRYVVERAPVEVYSDDQIKRLKTDTDPLDEPSVGAVARIGRFERLTKEPITEWIGQEARAGSTWAFFNDTTVDLTKHAPDAFDAASEAVRRYPADQLDPAGKPYRFAVYAYRVRAVDALGVESGPSAWALTIPPAVEDVFAKESGTTCELKWRGMARDYVSGYRVYRMEGPRANGPGQKVTRLTPGPVNTFTFTDRGATADTNRYWVVAVDRLGQEGIPSAPAWSNRQFRAFYRPFTGEWHQ
ncbi:hypothetical protein J0H58_01650 [bacterium]|nr:hypothetical protein [bacterium]